MINSALLLYRGLYVGLNKTFMMQCPKRHCISKPKTFNCGTQFIKTFHHKNVLVIKFKPTIQSYKSLHKSNALLRFSVLLFEKTIIKCNECLYKYSETMELLHNSCNMCTHVPPDMYTLIPQAVPVSMLQLLNVP